MNTALDSFAQNSPRVALGQIATLFLLVGLWAAHVILAQPTVAAPTAAPVQVASLAPLSGAVVK